MPLFLNQPQSYSKLYSPGQYIEGNIIIPAATGMFRYRPEYRCRRGNPPAPVGFTSRCSREFCLAVDQVEGTLNDVRACSVRCHIVSLSQPPGVALPMMPTEAGAKVVFPGIAAKGNQIQALSHGNVVFRPVRRYQRNPGAPQLTGYNHRIGGTWLCRRAGRSAKAVGAIAVILHVGIIIPAARRGVADDANRLKCRRFFKLYSPVPD